MNIKAKTLVNVSLLISLCVILSRFCSISTPVVRIGFGFVPIAICAIVYGPVWAGFVGGMADILGMLLFPAGSFFFGITISAVATGIVFGIFLYGKKVTNVRIGAAVFVNCICISLFLTTYWLSLLTGTVYLALLPTRIMQCTIMIPMQFIVIRVLEKYVSAYFMRFA